MLQQIILTISLIILSPLSWAQAGLPPVASPLPTAGETATSTRPLAAEAPSAPNNTPPETGKTATPPSRGQAFEQRQRLFEQRLRQF